MFKVVQRGGVYTGLSKGARGILFPDNGNERLAVPNGKNAERGDAALAQQRGEAVFIERMEDSVPDRFSEAGEIMKKRLCLNAEFVLIGLTKMTPVERREVRVRVKGGENQAAVGMKDAVPFPDRRQRRRH